MVCAKKSQGLSLNMIVIGAIALVILVILITILVSNMRSQDEQRAGVYNTVDLIEWCKCAKIVAPNIPNAKTRCEPVESLVGEFSKSANGVSIKVGDDTLKVDTVATTTTESLDETCGELDG